MYLFCYLNAYECEIIRIQIVIILKIQALENSQPKGTRPAMTHQDIPMPFRWGMCPKSGIKSLEQFKGA